MRRSAVILLPIIALLAGCPGSKTHTVARDAGSTRLDAAVAHDASVPDAAVAHDASVPDAAQTTDAASSSPICDGSDTMRLAITSGGGFVPSTYYFTDPYGSMFLFVDGKCRFYAYTSGTRGVVTGTLTAAQSDTLAEAIGYGFIEPWSHAPGDNPGCADGGTTTFYRPGASTSCYCGCDPEKTPAAKIAAMQQAYPQVMTIAKHGTSLDTDLSAIALSHDATPSSAALTWPLARSMMSIPDLIQPGAAPITGSARFTDPNETAQLRDLRAKAAANGFEVQDAGYAYSLYLRDELPTMVISALDALGVPRP